MEIPFDFVTIIHLAATVLGIASGMVIFYQSIKTNPINQPLAFGQITLSIAIVISFAAVSKLLVYWPFMFRTGSFFGLLYVPLPFLYVQFYTQKRTWKWFDLLHFIPALVFVVDFWPMLILSNKEKLALILKEINDLNLYAQLSDSRFFFPGFHQTFRTILFSGYWLLECRMLYRWVKRKSILSYEDRIWKNWIIVYLFFQVGLWLPFYLTFIWIDKALTYHMVYTTGATWLVLSSFLLLLYPSLLYGQQPYKDPKKTRRPKAPGEPGTGNGPEEQKLEDVKKVVDQGLDKDILFLKPGYTINEFSQDIGIPVYQISKCITHYTGMRFVDLINQKRIQYCVEKFKNGDWLNYKLEAIAIECGFNNRNSFTNAFKKFMGTSPSEYMSSIQITPVSPNT